VRRHGPLVLGACRRVLPNVQDAEDACQATFLVLAQKAKSNRWQPSIANRLYTTARKVAGNARLADQRQTRRESRAAVPEAVQPVDQMSARGLWRHWTKNSTNCHRSIASRCCSATSKA
jgi:DNA-directed RNA polymerase specialized sigma24 family protein